MIACVYVGAAMRNQHACWRCCRDCEHCGWNRSGCRLRLLSLSSLLVSVSVVERMNLDVVVTMVAGAVEVARVAVGVTMYGWYYCWHHSWV